MSLKTTYVAGEKLPAVDVNSITTAVNTNTSQLGAIFKTLEASEAIDGSSTPKAVVLNWTGSSYENKVALADASQSTKLKFLGFTRDDVASGANAGVQMAGVVGGFTGLTIGSEYFLKDIEVVITYPIENNNQNSEQVFGYNTSLEKPGQTFTVASETDVYSIIVKLRKANTPTDSVTMKIYGSDKTTLLATSTNSFTAASLSNTLAEKEFLFSGVTLSPGTYFLIVERTTINISHWYAIGIDTSQNYSGGQGFLLVSSSWTSQSYDLFFRIKKRVDLSGEIILTPTTNSVKIGRAVSATEIEIGKEEFERSADFGVGTWAPTALNQTKVITHSLGRKPKMIKIKWYDATNLQSTGPYNAGQGQYNGTKYACLYYNKTGNPGLSLGTSTTEIIYADSQTSGTLGWSATVSAMDSSSFTLTASSFATTENISFIWEVE